MVLEICLVRGSECTSSRTESFHTFKSDEMLKVQRNEKENLIEEMEIRYDMIHIFGPDF